ncbi:hypothetical protein Bca4012_020219 [Brassica carinata]
MSCQFAIWRAGKGPSRSPYGDMGLRRPGLHTVTWACVVAVAIRQDGSVSSWSPYCDLGLRRPGRHMATWVDVVPVAIRRPGLASSRSPYGDLGRCRPMATRLASSRSPYGDLADSPGLHTTIWIGIVPVAIRRPGLLLSRSPYGDLGWYCPGRHATTCVYEVWVVLLVV